MLCLWVVPVTRLRYTLGQVELRLKHSPDVLYHSKPLMPTSRLLHLCGPTLDIPVVKIDQLTRGSDRVLLRIFQVYSPL